MRKKIVNEGVDVNNLKNIEHPSYQNLMKLVIDYADGIIIETPSLDAEVADYLAASGNKVLEYQDKTTTEYLDNYQKFYDSL
jgi:starch synthase